MYIPRQIRRVTTCNPTHRRALAGQQAETGARLTDVVILDVNDELAQGLEMQPATAEPANVGEE